MLKIPMGKVSKGTSNEVAVAFVQGITEVSEPSTKSAAQLRDLRRRICLETMYSARHLNFYTAAAEFFVALLAVIYAIFGGKAVVDMIGHTGPGASYHLLKDWLREMGRVPVPPSGCITAGFDNEQRLLRNWLARGSNRAA